jgi:4-amino-4-deoxy-L-arabinose transferase-like glycosyltransferase
LRFFKLGSQSLWYDELFQHWAAQFPPLELINQVAADGQTPPLYYLITHFWLELVGWLAPDWLAAHPEAWLRLPSAVFGSLLLLVLYRLAGRLFGVTVARLSLVFLALNPLLVGYAQEGRAYSLALLLVALSFWYFLKLKDGPASRKDWLVYGLISSAALYTHYYCLYPLLAQALWFLGSWWPRRQWSRLKPWLLCQLITGLSFVPWVVVWWRVVSYTGAHLTLLPSDTDLLTVLRRGFGWFGLGNVEIWPGWDWKGPFDGAATLLMISGLLFLLGGAALALQHRKAGEWVGLLIWFGLGAFGPAITGPLVKLPNAPRYAIQGASPLMLLLAVSLGWLFLARPNKAKLTIGGIVALIWLGLMGWGLWNYYFNPDSSRDDWRGALATVAAEARPDDLLLGFPYHHFDPAQALYLGKRRWPGRAGGWSYTQSGALYFPGQRWGGYADFDKPQTAPSYDLTGDLARLVAPYRRIWVIAYSNPTNATILQWLGQHYRALPPRYFNPHQNLVLYRFDPVDG